MIEIHNMHSYFLLLNKEIQGNNKKNELTSDEGKLPTYGGIEYDLK